MSATELKMTGDSRLYRTGEISSSLFYRDPAAAMAWLQRAFGLEPCHVVETAAGELTHIEMSLGQSVVTIGGEWIDWAKSPASVGGANTQSLRVIIDGDVDALFQRAVAAGARVIQAPADQFYHQRTCRLADLEGHAWTFAHNLPSAPT
jgi:uncharacterized glyoxalase superfamily protein PhnB